MKDEKREHWLELCARAADEYDPQKLMKLIEQINRLLLEKENRLKSKTQDAGSSNWLELYQTAVMEMDAK
jgi:hypothetical protein